MVVKLCHCQNSEFSWAKCWIIGILNLRYPGGFSWAKRNLGSVDYVPWRWAKPSQTRPWTANSVDAAFTGELNLNDLHKSLPTSTILYICDLIFFLYNWIIIFPCTGICDITHHPCTVHLVLCIKEMWWRWRSK